MKTDDARHYATMSNVDLINCHAVNGAKIAKADQFLDAAKLALDEARRNYESATATLSAEQRERKAIESALGMRGYSKEKIHAYSVKLQEHLIAFAKSLESDEVAEDLQDDHDLRPAALADSGDVRTEVEIGSEDLGPAFSEEDPPPAGGQAEDDPQPEIPRSLPQVGVDVQAHANEREEGVVESEVRSQLGAPAPIEAAKDERESRDHNAGIVMREVRFDLDIDDGPLHEAPAAESGETARTPPPADSAADERAAYRENVRKQIGALSAAGSGANERNPLPKEAMVEQIDSSAIFDQVHASKRPAAAKPSPQSEDDFEDALTLKGSGLSGRQRRQVADLDDEDGSPGINPSQNTSPGIIV